MYSLYSDLNPDWTQRYAGQAEVLAYWEALIDKHCKCTFQLSHVAHPPNCSP